MSGHILCPVRDSLKIARRFSAGNQRVARASPVGTTEICCRRGPQPALRDWRDHYRPPSDKSLGYFRLSLRDILGGVQTSGRATTLALKWKFSKIPPPLNTDNDWP